MPLGSGGFQGPQNTIGREERGTEGEKEDNNGLTAFRQV